MSCKSICLIKVFICSIRTFTRSGTLSAVGRVASAVTCSVYIPAITEIVWGEGKSVISNHALPHLCAYRTAVNNTFNQGFENVGYVQIELFM